MNIYVAGSTKMVPEVNAVQDELRAAGHVIGFDWTGAEGEIRSDWTSVPSAARRIATTERAAVRGADAVVLVPPAAGHGLGLWIEVGIAIGLGIPVYVLGECRESVFWYVGCVERVADVEWLLEVL